MTEELGVLVLELPEPLIKYNVLRFTSKRLLGTGYDIMTTDFIDNVIERAYQCTRKEAEQFPQFKFVPLSEL